MWASQNGLKNYIYSIIQWNPSIVGPTVLLFIVRCSYNSSIFVVLRNQVVEHNVAIFSELFLAVHR